MSDDFDIDSWLTEAKPPQRAVTVYGRGDLVSRLQELTAQRKSADVSEVRLAGHPLDGEIASLRAELEGSKRVFHVRGLLEAERSALIDKHTTPANGDVEEVFDVDGYETEAFSLAVIDPPVTVAQVKRMHEALGEGQWNLISVGVGEATTQSVDVPLSRLGSESTPNS